MWRLCTSTGKYRELPDVGSAVALVWHSTHRSTPMAWPPWKFRYKWQLSQAAVRTTSWIFAGPATIWIGRRLGVAQHAQVDANGLAAVEIQVQMAAVASRRAHHIVDLRGTRDA